jgi:hypothetical protein
MIVMQYSEFHLKGWSFLLAAFIEQFTVHQRQRIVKGGCSTAIKARSISALFAADVLEQPLQTSYNQGLSPSAH